MHKRNGKPGPAPRFALGGSQVFAAGIAMGIGKAEVYKHIPDYFPHDVGVVGGMVGVLGVLGGFIFPVIFGYLLSVTGIWTTAWMFLAIVSMSCLVWMYMVIQRMLRQRTLEVAHHIEDVTYLAE